MNARFVPPTVAATVPGHPPSPNAAAASVGGNPIGHDAPKHSVAWANFEAARIAAREVRGRAMFSPAHRESLEAWQRGERAWPWPESDDTAADDAVRGLVDWNLKYGGGGVMVRQYTLKLSDDPELLASTLDLMRRAARAKGMKIGHYAVRAIRSAAQTDLGVEP